MFIAPDDYIGETILAECVFEKGYLSSLEALFAAAERSGAIDIRGGVALDIGANVGNHTLFFARHFRKVLSFEPNPMIGRVLEANVLFNPPLRDRTEVHRVALSNIDETLPYKQHFSNLGGSGFNRDGAAEEGAQPLELSHAGRYVGSALAEGDRLACVKIDVEGLEDKVIEGLQDLLRRDMPIVVTEVTDPAAGARIRELLAQCGYQGLYEIHNALQFGTDGIVQRLWQAMRHKVTYTLVPAGDLGGRIYPMLIAAPAAVIAAAPRAD